MKFSRFNKSPWTCWFNAFACFCWKNKPVGRKPSFKPSQKSHGHWYFLNRQKRGYLSNRSTEGARYFSSVCTNPTDTSYRVGISALRPLITWYVTQWPGVFPLYPAVQTPNGLSGSTKWSPEETNFAKIYFFLNVFPQEVLNYNSKYEIIILKHDLGR